MRFVITPRGFILPTIAGLILLFQHWVPGARALSIGLNIAALVILALDYFSLPGPQAFSATRLLPDKFFHQVPAQIGIRLAITTSIPIRMKLLDRPPLKSRHEPVHFSTTAPRGGGETVVRYEMTPQIRGPLSFGKLGIRLSSSLGLVARQFTLDLGTTVQVFPRFPAWSEGLQSRFYFAQVDGRMSRTYGAGREFHQMREYRRGDDIRSIHWKRSARSGKLIVKEFLPEKGQNVFLMIDGGRLMMAETKGRSKVDWAVASAIALAREALGQRDSVGVAGFANQIHSYALPSNGKPQLSSLVRTIYDFQPQFIEPDYQYVFQWAYRVLKQRCIIIVYTDFADPGLSSELAAQMRFLRRKHRIICCAIGNAGMQNLGFRTTDTLRDALFSAVVRESMDNRSQVMHQLSRAGIDVVDVAPTELSAATLNAYARARWKS